LASSNSPLLMRSLCNGRTQKGASAGKTIMQLDHVVQPQTCGLPCCYWCPPQKSLVIGIDPWCTCMWDHLRQKNAPALDVLWDAVALDSMSVHHSKQDLVSIIKRLQGRMAHCRTPTLGWKTSELQAFVRPVLHTNHMMMFGRTSIPLLDTQ